MDTSALAASAFGALPYFNPMMMGNTSGTCATTRLTHKFNRDPERTTDPSLEDFMARKAVIEQVGRWSEDTKEEWAPILYLYERDWGHLIFTDMTLTRFLLVMGFPEECTDRFMSLLKYLHHTEGKPDWVRATYVTKSNGYTLDPLFLKTFDSPTSDVRKISHITGDTFVPSLLSNELDSIDTLLKQGGKRVPKTVRYQVLGSKDSRPDVSAVWKSKNSRQCAQCNTSQHLGSPVVQQVLKRSRGPMHKLVCKKA
ncbi:hypothetical protein DFH09DRAFT_1241852 [Mycena vulgaris]|nr:hypothetical protein DFH09DRAFT_1241852 [Mycena vulgaris]